VHFAAESVRLCKPDIIDQDDEDVGAFLEACSSRHVAGALRSGASAALLAEGVGGKGRMLPSLGVSAPAPASAASQEHRSRQSKPTPAERK